jgi:hypothetical protein
MCDPIDNLIVNHLRAQLSNESQIKLDNSQDRFLNYSTDLSDNMRNFEPGALDKYESSYRYS